MSKGSSYPGVIGARTARAIMAVLIASIGTPALSAPSAPSIAIKFGAAEPSPSGATSNVAGAAGVLGTVKWNNLSSATGTDIALNQDNAGTSIASSALITYFSNGTWSSIKFASNDTDTGQNGNLMAGYLDNVSAIPSSVTVRGMDAVFGAGLKSLYVYHNGDVQGRGGIYAVGGATPESIVHTDNAVFNGSFIPGEDFDIFTFTGDAFTLDCTPTIGDGPNHDGAKRTPLNGIEIVAAIPEPGTLSLLGLLSLGIVSRRKRK
jgi:hypothetical protein